MPSPKKNVTLTVSTYLVNAADATVYRTNPTIAAGDFKISKDGGALANLTNLPTVTPASGKRVQIILTAAEMNADVIEIQCIDASGAEWLENMITIYTDAYSQDDIGAKANSLLFDGSSFVKSVQQYTTLTVATDAGNTAATFKTDLTQGSNDYWIGAYFQFTSGVLIGQVKKISGYNGTTKFLSFSSNFTAIPTAGDLGKIINQ